MNQSMITLFSITNSLIMLSFFSYFISRKKILMMLMSLEYILLNMFFMLLLTLMYMSNPVSPTLYMLVLGACEASLGLSILINMSRFKGNDLLTKHTMKF